VLVELSTDNRNRTAAEIRSLLTKSGGSIAAAGAVSRLFHRRGQFIVLREAAGEDHLMELALEAGADDFKAEPEGYEILTDPGHFEAVAQTTGVDGDQVRRSGSHFSGRSSRAAYGCGRR